jgi:hypothetical protein
MSGSVRCPHCGHVLFAIELPISPPVQARDVSPPDALLLLRVPEAARLLGVSRSRMYELVASGQVPVSLWVGSSNSPCLPLVASNCGTRGGAAS